MVRDARADDPVLTMTDTDSAQRERADPQPAHRGLEPAAGPEHPTTEQPAPERPDDRAARARPSRRPPSSRRPPPRRPRRLYRSRDDRVIAGVCGGIARYFNIDPVLVRVGAVALVFLGGAGVFAYLAAVLLIPKEGEGGRRPRRPAAAWPSPASSLLVVAIGVVLPFRAAGWRGWGLVPLGLLALAGLFVWRLASGQRPQGDARAVLRAHGARPRADRALLRRSPSAAPGPPPRAATASSPGSSSPPASR